MARHRARRALRAGRCECRGVRRVARRRSRSAPGIGRDAGCAAMTLEALPPFVGVGLFAAVVCWLLARRTYLVIALLWLLIPMCWRLASSLHIDLAGPVFAEQVIQHVGPG